MRGHVRKRGQKSWAVILDVGRDASGTSIVKEGEKYDG